jgi:hypothetical protein
MIQLTDEQKLAIKTAEAINKHIDDLYNDIDFLLTPIVKLGIGSTDPVEIRALADLLPRGFYRSELRTLANVLENEARNGKDNA